MSNLRMTHTNTENPKSWAEVAPVLVAVAAGRMPADLVIRGGRLVNVQSREILDGWQVAIAAGRFAYVGPDADHCIGNGTEVVDAGGRYLIPGLCDGHMHIESGMLTPGRVRPRGHPARHHDDVHRSRTRSPM